MKSIAENIQRHYINKNLVKLTRLVAPATEIKSCGYIVDFSDEFIVLQESSDFYLFGYLVLPVYQVKTIRHNASDRCYTGIMRKEGIAERVGIRYKVDLTTWQTIFTSLRKRGLIVTVECEQPEIDGFSIGRLVASRKRHVLMRYFDPMGVLDKHLTSIDYESITNVGFDGNYANVFAKYLRETENK